MKVNAKHIFMRAQTHPLLLAESQETNLKSIHIIFLLEIHETRWKTFRDCRSYPKRVNLFYKCYSNAVSEDPHCLEGPLPLPPLPTLCAS